MPYNANFSVTQSIDCATITITDTSSNPSSEVITDRKLYLQKADGTYIAPPSQTVLVGAANATAQFRFFGLVSVGSTIVVAWVDPILGYIEYPYVLQSGDTTIPILSANFCAAQNGINGFSFVYNSGTDRITITAPAGYGSSINYSGSGTGTGFLRIIDISYANVVSFAGGSYGTPTMTTGLDYYDFSPYLFPSNNITIPLPQDYALDIVFQAIPAVVTSGSIYIKEIMQAFVCNLQQFQLGKIKTLSATPSVINNQNFESSLYSLNTEINNASLAVSEGLDIQSSQAAIDRGIAFITNQNNFF